MQRDQQQYNVFATLFYHYSSILQRLLLTLRAYTHNTNNRKVKCMHFTLNSGHVTMSDVYNTV